MKGPTTNRTECQEHNTTWDTCGKNWDSCGQFLSSNAEVKVCCDSRSTCYRLVCRHVQARVNRIDLRKVIDTFFLRRNQRWYLMLLRGDGVSSFFPRKSPQKQLPRWSVRGAGCGSCEDHSAIKKFVSCGGETRTNDSVGKKIVLPSTVTQMVWAELLIFNSFVKCCKPDIVLAGARLRTL